MRRFCLFLIALILTAAVFPAFLSAEDAEEEISFHALENLPTAVPDPNATPGPTAAPAPTAEPVLQADGSIEITITAVGDVTIGWDVEHERKGNGLFDKELKRQGGDPNFIFRNVRDIFTADDLTIANFEGVLADDTVNVRKKGNNHFRFVGDVSYAQVLKKNGVEAVTMENNHIGDFGQAGIESTANAIESTGVVWANTAHMGVFEAQGFRIGMLAYCMVEPLNSSENPDVLRETAVRDIAAAREECDLVIVSFHWGKEKDYSPRDYQIMLGHAVVDAGADLVLGHHSHRINPIECYNGKYIVYSLANCSFAGNNKPDDMFTYIFQARFRFKNGEIVGNPFRIIPCRISSRKDYNDFMITPLTDASNINTVMMSLTNRQNTKKLPDAIKEYPMEWE